MKWQYKFAPGFLKAYRAFPKWRRKCVRERTSAIKQSEDPLTLASRKGRLARFPFLGPGNLLIAEVDDKNLLIVFTLIQVQ